MKMLVLKLKLDDDDALLLVEGSYYMLVVYPICLVFLQYFCNGHCTNLKTLRTLNSRAGLYSFPFYGFPHKV
jgi:hypothetical protein